MTSSSFMSGPPTGVNNLDQAQELNQNKDQIPNPHIDKKKNRVYSVLLLYVTMSSPQLPQGKKQG